MATVKTGVGLLGGFRSWATALATGALLWWSPQAQALDFATCDGDVACQTVCTPADALLMGITCDYDSLGDCATGAGTAAGDTCLAIGGTYHETVDYTNDAGTYVGRADLVFDCADDQRCVVDGDWRRENAFLTHSGWTLRNLEIRNTVGFAITAGAGSSRGVWSVEDCWIHDAGGGVFGLAADGLAARNRLENLAAAGIQCAGFSSNQLITDNLLINPNALGGGYAISCGATGSLVTHNTVQVFDGEQPYAGNIASGINAANAACNVVVGGDTGLRATVSSYGNLVWNWSTADYSSPLSIEDQSGDPAFANLDDLHPGPLSAATDPLDAGNAPLCVRAPGDTDQQGTPRDATPDIGALERPVGYVPVSPQWPVRDNLNDDIPVPLLTAGASPALLTASDGTPHIAWIDTTTGPNSLWFGTRQSDGTWRAELVHEITSPLLSAPVAQAVSLAEDPDTGLVSVAWVSVNGEVLYATRTADGCGTDCTSSQWSGCSDFPAYDGPTGLFPQSVDLAFDPFGSGPTIGILDGNLLTVFQVSGGPGMWASTLVDAPVPGRTFSDFDFEFDPVTGAADYVMVMVEPDFFTLGDLIYSTDNGGGPFFSTVLDLSAGVYTYPGWNGMVALAHGDFGELGVAFTGSFDEDLDGTSTEGIGFIERVGAVWDTPAVLVHGQVGTYQQGLDLDWADDGTPRVVASTGGIVATAWRDGADEWQSRLDDVRYSAGDWVQVHIPDGTGELMVVHQESQSSHPIRFLSTFDPGGIDPAFVDASECDQCPADPLKTEPGDCGCGVPDTDSDGDGTADCIDDCVDDPLKTAPGICDCGTPDTDTDGDGTADCLDSCPDDADKTAPGICDCGTPDTDTDGDGTADCLDSCPDDADKTSPGDCGCDAPDTDTDGDGTADCIDGCPDDANKTAPGQCGCEVADDDTDGDGTADCLDDCPSDPLKSSPGQCGCDVVDVDRDGDTIADCVDNCPDDIYKTEPGLCGCNVLDDDNDGDGTPDCDDVCPADPGKTEPGICGCNIPDSDFDGDGVPDCGDGCPADASKTEPGICGCGLPDIDSDGDTVLDCEDNCPSDPLKTTLGICGCGMPDVDSDGDGVLDCNDACPADANKSAQGVCGCGVDDGDSDGDTVPDCNDACPDDGSKTEPGVCGCDVADTDSDGDGLPDCDDLCPDDALKTEPGACGCDVADADTDGDGALDCEESCPDDPDKTEPGECGCDVPESECGTDGTPGTDPDNTDKDPSVCGCQTPASPANGLWLMALGVLLQRRRSG